MNIEKKNNEEPKKGFKEKRDELLENAIKTQHQIIKTLSDLIDYEAAVKDSPEPLVEGKSKDDMLGLIADNKNQLIKTLAKLEEFIELVKDSSVT